MNFLEMQSYIENHIKDSVNFPISTIFNEIDKNLKWSCITLHDGLIGPEFEEEIKNSNLPENEKTRILKNPEHYLKSPVGGWKEFQTKKNIYYPSSKTRIGIVTGRISKIIVLDVDNIDKFKMFLGKHNIQFDTNTFTVQTGKGGFHYYYIYPDDGIVYYCTQDKDNGIDVRAESGFVLSFGSLHPNGNYYRIVNPVPIAPAPQWLLDYVHQRNLNRKKDNIMKQYNNTKKLTDEEFNNIFKSVDMDLEYLDIEIQNLIKNGCALHHRSEAIGKILFHMIVEGYTYDEIKSVCFNKSYGISEKFYEREATFFDNEYKSSVNEVNRLGLKIKTKSSKNKVKFDPVIAGINIINSFEYYITPDNMIYAKHKLDNNENEYINIESKQFAPIVSKAFRETYCKSISKQNLDLVLLEASLVAKKIAKQADSLCRFLQQKDRLIYYTGDKDNFIVIDSNGYRLENNLDIVVKKSEYIKPITDIKMNMSGTENLNKFLNILDITNDYYRHTLILTLIGYLYSNISTPVLYLYGEGGSSKTSILSYLKAIFDPFDPIDKPKKSDILAKFLDKMGIAHFDNFSSLSSDLQDGFCQSYSGGSSSFIKLYSDDDILNYSYKCPLMLSAVNIPYNIKNDFYSRVTFLKMHKHSQIQSEEDIESELLKLYPYVRGELFSLASKIFSIYSSFKPTNLTRHADFDKIGKAYFTIIGKTEDDYVKLIKTKLSNDAKVYISSDPVITKFVEIVLRDKFKFFNVSEILKEIEDELDDDYIEIKPREFGIKLKNISDKLAGLGIKIYPGKKANPSRPYLAVTNEFLSDHKDFDTSILDNKVNINRFYNDYKKSLEQSAVNEVINSIS